MRFFFAFYLRNFFKVKNLILIIYLYDDLYFFEYKVFKYLVELKIYFKFSFIMKHTRIYEKGN